jgi:tetratricopeptide (TPR) repeat protein
MVVLVALGIPVLTRGPAPVGGPQTPADMGGATGGGNVVDLTTMSLEDQGTLLFNRVMTSNSNGDTADVEFFLPKALVIYEQLNPADADGRYHYALLYQVGGDFEAALAKAREGLEEIPDYLLLLAVAGEASASLGDDTGAREYYSRFLEVYDAEMALMRPGYEHHQSIFPVYRDEARAYLGVG